MSHDTILTKPIGDPSAPASTTEIGGSDTPRRRLGSWQVAPGGTDTFAAAPAHSPAAAAGTIPIGGSMDATVAFPVTPEYVPSPSDATLPFSEREAKRMEWEAEQQRQASTVPLVQPPADATVPISAPSSWDVTAPISHSTVAPDVTAPMSPPVASPDVTAPMRSDPTAQLDAGSHADVTVQLAGGVTVPISMPQSAELVHLRRRLSDDPEDLDTALELALALQEAGSDASSASILTTLLHHYEAIGAVDSASQVRRLLGSAVTADIRPASPHHSATIPLADATAEAATAAAGDATAPITPLTGQTTAQLAARTVPLDRRAAAGRQGRRPSKAQETAPPTLLPPDELIFTEPLPALDGLTPHAADLLAGAELEARSGHFRSALDSVTLAMAMAPSALGLWVRAVEIRLRLGHRRKAAALLDTLRSLSGGDAPAVPTWMVDRLALHTVEPGVADLSRVVNSLVEAGQSPLAASYASALIRLLDASGDPEDAVETATRMASLLPGETRVALEGAVLAVRHGSHGEVVDLWEAAVASGADAEVAKASLAASVASASEPDHWRLLGETLDNLRADPSSLCRDAYLRTASAAGPSPILTSGCALVLHVVDDPAASDALTTAAGDRHGTPIGRAAASLALASRLAAAGKGPEYISAIRTTLTLMADDTIGSPPDWLRLTGVTPNLPELSTELGEALLEAGDAAGAVEVLRVWHRGDRQHPPLVRLLADAYARTGQVGSALTILDELGMHHRKAGQLDEMAAVLRQMSRLAPRNIKVKSRLIDAYLQRGFVSEARAELIQRADLEIQGGHEKDACRSLQRAADLSWNLGLMNEAFGLYDRLLEIDPEDVGNRSALVNLYLQVGRLSEAAEHQRAVVDIALRNGRRHEAIAALHQVIGLTPDDMTAYYQLGELLASMGEYQQAEKVYRRIVLMMPDDAVAQAKATAMAALKEEMTAS